MRSWILIPVSKNNKTTPLIQTSAAKPSTPPAATLLLSPVMLLKLFSLEFSDFSVLFFGLLSSIFIVFVPENGTSFLILKFDSSLLTLLTSTLSLFDCISCNLRYSGGRYKLLPHSPRKGMRYD